MGDGICLRIHIKARCGKRGYNWRPRSAEVSELNSVHRRTWPAKAELSLHDVALATSSFLPMAHEKLATCVTTPILDAVHAVYFTQKANVDKHQSE